MSKQLNLRLVFLLPMLALLAACLLPAQAAAQKTPRIKRVQDTLDAPIEGTGPAYAQRPDAVALADEIAYRHELNRKWVRQAIGRARQLPQLAKLVIPPPVEAPRNWAQYRGRFLDAERVRAGVAFWEAHREALARASATYGVEPEIIVGILGVETFFGRHTGRYRVMDALATLALDFPTEHPRAGARTAFFRSELGAFLKLQSDAGRDPFRQRGSYAGAMGIPQFMPSSWARYAVDFDGDGRIDLSGSMVDAIGSVANYFKTFNWRPGMPTHYPVEFDYERLDMPALLQPDIKPTFAPTALADKGVLLGDTARRHAGPLALVELQNGNYSPTYVAGTENFYVVTRYNWSAYYALAVIELGQAVAAALPKVQVSTQVSATPANTGCAASMATATTEPPICR